MAYSLHSGPLSLLTKPANLKKLMRIFPSDDEIFSFSGRKHKDVSRTICFLSKSYLEQNSKIGTKCDGNAVGLHVETSEIKNYVLSIPHFKTRQNANVLKTFECMKSRRARELSPSLYFSYTKNKLLKFGHFIPLPREYGRFTDVRELLKKIINDYAAFPPFGIKVSNTLETFEGSGSHFHEAGMDEVNFTSGRRNPKSIDISELNYIFHGPGFMTNYSRSHIFGPILSQKYLEGQLLRTVNNISVIINANFHRRSKKIKSTTKRSMWQKIKDVFSGKSKKKCGSYYTFKCPPEPEVSKPPCAEIYSPEPPAPPPCPPPPPPCPSPAQSAASCSESVLSPPPCPSSSPPPCPPSPPTPCPPPSPPPCPPASPSPCPCSLTSPPPAECMETICTESRERRPSIVRRFINYFKARPNCPTPADYKRRKTMKKLKKLADKANLGVYDPCDDPCEICKEVEKRCLLSKKNASCKTKKQCYHTYATLAYISTCTKTTSGCFTLNTFINLKRIQSFDEKIISQLHHHHWNSTLLGAGKEMAEDPAGFKEPILISD